MIIKKLTFISLCFVSTIIGLVGIFFTVMEGRLLFSLDWSIYPQPTLAFFRYASRLVLALFVITTAVLHFLSTTKRLQSLSSITIILFSTLLVVSIIIAIFSTNNLSLICLIPSVLAFALKLLLVVLEKRNRTSN